MAAAALATVGLASPVRRQHPSTQYNLLVTSLEDTKYTSQSLSTCHTSAGGSALCVYEDDVAAFTFGPQPAAAGDIFEIYYQGSNSGGAKQQLLFQPNGTVSGLEYGFFGPSESGYYLNFSMNADNQLTWSSFSESSTSFYICPEYIDYDHEGYPTLSVSTTSVDVPSDCDEVRVTAEEEILPK